MGIPRKVAVLSLGVAVVASLSFAHYVKAIAEAHIYENTTIAIAEAAKPVPPPDKLVAWINLLGEKESGNTAHIKVLDVNNRYSYGCLQFQMATWLGMGKTYGIHTTTENIYDCTLQKQLAYKMIKTRPANWHHWGYTVLKRGGTGLPPNA